MEYKVTIRVADGPGGKERQRTVGSVSGEDISKFRSRMLEAEAALPGPGKRYSSHRNSPEAGRLEAFIARCEELLPSLISEKNRIEAKIRSINAQVAGFEKSAGACEGEIRCQQKKLQEAHSAIARQKEDTEPGFDRRIACLQEKIKPMKDDLDLVIALSGSSLFRGGFDSSLGLFSGISEIEVSKADGRVVKLMVNEDAKERGIDDAIEMITNIARLTREISEFYPHKIYRFTMKEVGMETGWLESISSSAPASLPRIRPETVGAVIFTCSEILREKDVLLENVKAVREAISVYEMRQARMAQSLRIAGAKPGVSAGWRRDFGKSLQLYSSCLACTKEVYQLLRDIANSRKPYIKAMRDYQLAAEGLKAAEEKREGIEAQRQSLPSPRELRVELAAAEKVVAEVRSASQQASDALWRLDRAADEKERRSRAHVSNSPSTDQRKKADAGIAHQAVFWKAVQSEEPPMPCAEERKRQALGDFVLRQKRHFRSFLEGAPAQVSRNFEDTMLALAELYMKNGGTLHYKAIEERFPNSSRAETNRDYKEYNIVRLGFAAANFYRVLIDVKDPKRPAIFFAGIKHKSDDVLERKTSKFINHISRAIREGQDRAFEPLKEFAQPQQPNGRNGGQ